MSKFHDKQRYIEETLKGKSHRQISKLGDWSVSSSLIRDELIRDGVIVKSHTVVDKAKRSLVFYTVTGKEIPSEAPVTTWEDGTPKSRGNAFDLSIAKGIFTKSELASVYNKGRPSNYNTPVQVIVYSRA